MTKITTLCDNCGLLIRHPEERLTLATPKKRLCIACYNLWLDNNLPNSPTKHNFHLNPDYIKNMKGGDETMPSIKELAKVYQPKQTKNIAELQEVSVDLDVKVAIANEGKDTEFTYNYIVVNGEEYRVPDKILKDLKVVLEKKPTLQKFSVSKSGTGLNTTYTLIPLD